MQIYLDQPAFPTLQGFMFFWLKSVRGFDSSQHCARCLIGSYSKVVNKNMDSCTWKELEPLAAGEVYYLCGVSKPYRWHKNYHLVFVADEQNPESELVETLWTGATIRVKGAKEIPFTAETAINDWSEKGTKFVSCRNFQFGAQWFKNKDQNQGLLKSPGVFKNDAT